MNLDEHEIRALAFLAARRRPKGSSRWDEPGIVAAVSQVAHLDAGEVILATIRAAMNASAKTPGVIPVLSGEHWRDRKPTSEAPRNVLAPHRCGVCGKAEDHALHANDHPFERLHEGAATVRVDELRAALRGTA